MKTTIINNEFKGLKQIENGDYVFDGDLIVEGHLEIDLDDRLIVKGHIKAGGYIEAEEHIEAGGYIEAEEHIKAGGYIEAEEHIEAGGYIEAEEHIKAGGHIKAGEYIEVGEDYGISAGLFITCKGVLKLGLKVFAGICTWRDISDEEKTITCSKIEGGVVEYGILEETGEQKRTIDFDGKKVEISEESYQAFKEQFKD